jgi:hypothetical protein
MGGKPALRPALFSEARQQGARFLEARQHGARGFLRRDRKGVRSTTPVASDSTRGGEADRALMRAVATPSCPARYIGDMTSKRVSRQIVRWGQMRTRGVAFSLCLASLTACARMHPPSVERSTIQISVAQRGDLQSAETLLNNVIYIEKPVWFSPNVQRILFIADASEHHATAVKATFGQEAGRFVEVKDGIRPGDHVIVSDMAQFEFADKIDLRSGHEW